MNEQSLPPSKPSKKWIGRLWHLLAIIVVGYLAYKFIDFRAVGSAIISTPPKWIAIILLLVTIDRMLMGLKWWQLLRAGGTNVPFTTTTSAYYQASLIQYILPSSLSGDAIRAMIVTQRHGETAMVVASMIVEKLLGIVSAALLGALGILLASQGLFDDNLWQIIVGSGLLLAGVGGGFWLSFSEKLAHKIIGWIPVKKVQAGIRKMYDHYLLFIKQPGLLLSNLGITAVEHIVQISIITACAIAIGVETPVTVVFLAIAISQFLRKIVIVIEGWVLGELTNVLVCVAMGIPESQALAFSLLAHMLNIAGTLPGAPLIISSSGAFSLRGFRQSPPDPEKES